MVSPGTATVREERLQIVLEESHVGVQMSQPDHSMPVAQVLQREGISWASRESVHQRANKREWKRETKENERESERD